MVAAIFPGGMQPHHHLVSPPIFAQVLGKTCEVTFGQPSQHLHYLLALVHSVKTMHPKHDSDLDFQGQHAAKRFLPRIHQPSAIHDDSAKHEMGPLCSVPLNHLFLGPIPASRQDLGSQPKKCTHGGYPLESPLVFKLPHVMSLHQSDPLMESLNHVARSVWTHSNLISVAVQDGEFAPVDCLVLGADRDSLRHVEDPTPPADGPRMFQRPLQTLHP